MSEDYKKIALEDVKKGQRVRVVERHPAFTVTYEGAVFRTNPEWDRIDLGGEGDEVTIIVDPEPEPDVDFDIRLLQDVPEPKVVSIETVTVTRYDDGTEKTETVSEGIPVPMRDDGGTEWVPTPTAIHSMVGFEEFEDYLKTVILKDTDGDYWAYRDGQWRWTFATLSPGITWHTPTTPETIEQSLPMTVVENVGD